jgi:hypothetical protein
MVNVATMRDHRIAAAGVALFIAFLGAALVAANRPSPSTVAGAPHGQFLPDDQFRKDSLRVAQGEKSTFGAAVAGELTLLPPDAIALVVDSRPAAVARDVAAPAAPAAPVSRGVLETHAPGVVRKVDQTAPAATPVLDSADSLTAPSPSPSPAPDDSPPPDDCPVVGTVVSTVTGVV